MKALPMALIAAAFVATTASPSHAQETVSIRVEVSWSPYAPLSEATWPDYSGTFMATGAVVDGGAAQYGPWYPDSVLRLRGTAGDIDILLDNAGGWVVETGTGAYACLHGGGRYTELAYVVDDPFLGETWVVEFDLTGVVEHNVQPDADLAVVSVNDRTAEFSAAGSRDPDGSIVRYDFDFDGDGSYDTSSVYADARHTYAADGTYVAAVRVTDDCGATDVAFVTVTIQAPPPQPEEPGKGKGGNGKGKKH